MTTKNNVIFQYDNFLTILERFLLLLVTELLLLAPFGTTVFFKAKIYDIFILETPMQLQ